MLVQNVCLIQTILQFGNFRQARIQRGGPGVRTPPLRFVRGGVLCRSLMGRRGGPTVVFILLLSIFSGSLRSPVLYKRITYIHTFKFNIQSSFLYITLILMKRIQLTISYFHERASSYFSCQKVHDFTPFKTKIYWGGPPDPPPPRHGYNIKLPCHLCACVERGLQLYKRPCPTEKKACM